MTINLSDVSKLVSRFMSAILSRARDKVRYVGNHHSLYYPNKSLAATAHGLSFSKAFFDQRRHP
ncbi:hypothetical protein [Sphingomonas sp.]|uniref:hypothetical protein n=1 Tax=Sphingomonas sp. TaxID=28214 RepID=UPI00325FC306